MRNGEEWCVNTGKPGVATKYQGSGRKRSKCVLESVKAVTRHEERQFFDLCKLIKH